ncbi:hypothetical protein NQ317_002052 [Molorchus minor]|uniref:MADF domain-containing protein n=1 Tax=Molorchus minor TaxID=1323400 RepID=A0ABQ9JF03_9CUCU|nr:hypothetical protein NQ317_002052 [Molorchus minor]
MLETVPPIISQEHFIRALLTAYKEHSILWDKNHPQYRNRTERSKALQELIEISRRYTPEADEDFVKVKVDSLRSTFRREWRKVCLSKTKATESEDVYKPTLWYYNLLLFTVGGESEENNEKCDDSVDTPKTSWNREYTAILIGLLKKTPLLIRECFKFCAVEKESCL